MNKLVQTVNFLLQKNGKSLNYTKMIKLLYMADRRALEECGSSITGDTYASLPQGPILSRLYDLIRNKPHLPQDQTIIWNTFFLKSEYNLTLTTENNLNTDELSRRELRILHEVDREFKHYDKKAIIDHIHNKNLFPEVKWQEARNGGVSSIPLPIEDIYEAVGIDREDYLEIIDENRKVSREKYILHDQM